MVHRRVFAESAAAGPPGRRSHAHRRPLWVAAGHGRPGTAILQLLGPVDCVQDRDGTFAIPLRAAVSVGLVEHFIEIKLWHLVLLRITVVGGLLQGLGADRCWRMLRDLGPDVGIAVVRISRPCGVFAVVPVAVTAGARQSQRLIISVSGVAAAAADQCVNFCSLLLPLGLDLLITHETDLFLVHRIGKLVGVRAFDFFLDSELDLLL